MHQTLAFLKLLVRAIPLARRLASSASQPARGGSTRKNGAESPGLYSSQLGGLEFLGIFTVQSNESYRAITEAHIQGLIAAGTAELASGSTGPE